MDQLQLFLLGGVLLSTLVATGVAIYTVLSQRRQSQILQMELFRQHDFRSQKTDEPQDSLMLELLRRISEISPEVHVTVNNSDGDSRESGPRTHSTETRNEAQSVVAEIAHSLNTPLSQIEAAVLVLTDSFGEGNATEDIESRQSLDRILSSVEICKIFIGAYGELSKVAARSKDWTSRSLSEAISKAGTVYDSRDGQIKYTGLEEVPGYSNTFILAAILPLIENAAEATQDATAKDDQILVSCYVADNLLHLSVSNALNGRVLGDVIYETGETTKDGHAGLGLSAIRRLVAAHSGTLSHAVINDRVTFCIDLPEKSK